MDAGDFERHAAGSACGRADRAGADRRMQRLVATVDVRALTRSEILALYENVSADAHSGSLGALEQVRDLWTLNGALSTCTAAIWWNDVRYRVATPSRRRVDRIAIVALR